MPKNIILYMVYFCLYSISFGQVDYSEVYDIFQSHNCIDCHGSSGGLNLSSYDNLMMGNSNNGPVIIPFDHVNSVLWLRVTAGEMPPPEENYPLTGEEVDLIAKWIDEGALEQPGPSSGCTDENAYNCLGSMAGEYVNEIGVIIYDYSCDGNINHAGSEDCNAGELCEGYYNPGATIDDGTCRYYQAPNGDEEIELNEEEDGISVDWSAFNPPPHSEGGLGGAAGDLESYHVQRCLGESCTWMPGFTPADENVNTSLFDEFNWETGIEIKYAIAVKYKNNPYWGWAIGASYITPGICINLGDLNGDGGWNVLDVVVLANCVLTGTCNELEHACAGDMNDDGGFNVLDIVTLANCVLTGTCGGRVDDASHAQLIIKDNILSIEADGFIGGVEMNLSHGADFSIKMTDRALFADYLSNTNETHLLVITPETDELFSYNGDFEITEIIVANSHTEVSVDLPLASSFILSDAYPNPFNPVTTLNFTIFDAGNINVQVYNLNGHIISTLLSGYKVADTYSLIWNATNATSGMYFVRAQVNGFTKTQKLMLIK